MWKVPEREKKGGGEVKLCHFGSEECTKITALLMSTSRVILLRVL